MEAQDLIIEADKIRQEMELTQAEWSRRAGYDEYGKLISNAFLRGDCKVSVLARLLEPLGYELRIVRVQDGTDSGSDKG